MLPPLKLAHSSWSRALERSLGIRLRTVHAEARLVEKQQKKTLMESKLAQPTLRTLVKAQPLGEVRTSTKLQELYYFDKRFQAQIKLLAAAVPMYQELTEGEVCSLAKTIAGLRDGPCKLLLYSSRPFLTFVRLAFDPAIQMPFPLRKCLVRQIESMD